MPAYSAYLNDSLGRTNVLQAIKEQVKNRFDALYAQRKAYLEHDAFLDERNIGMLNNRISEITLLIEALDVWIEEGKLT